MAKRKSINYPGFKHENPIPNASLVGNILMSSIISGRDPDTGAMPSGAADGLERTSAVHSRRSC